MNSLWLKTGAVAASSVWSIAAFAAATTTSIPADPAVVGKSQAATAQVQKPKKPLPFSINSLNILNGPPVAHPSQKSSVAGWDGAFQPLFVRNQLSVRYKIADKWSIQPVLDFDLIMAADNKSNPFNETIAWRDCFVRINRSGIVDTKVGGHTLTVDGDLRWYVPTGRFSSENKTIGSARLSLNPSIQFDRSPWSLSAVNFVRHWVQSRELAVQGFALPRTTFYTGPQVNYAFNDMITAFVLYEASVGFDTKGVPDTSVPQSSNADVSPGVNINLHERLQLTPSLFWYTNRSIDTTAMQLTASLKLL